jgi:hypothetical protein
MEGAVLAFPCATQNEITKEDADKLVAGGVKYVFEGTPPAPQPVPPARLPRRGRVAVCPLVCGPSGETQQPSLTLFPCFLPACRCQHALYSGGYCRVPQGGRHLRACQGRQCG